MDTVQLRPVSSDRAGRVEVPPNLCERDHHHHWIDRTLSHDAKQWTVARDLYLQCIAEDPHYAPAWARLGRMHHVIAKYSTTGTQKGLEQAEAAFRRALQLNPDLAIAHKLFAQLEVDLGRAHDAMARLIERAHSADPELLAGLVSACRYCGLLTAGPNSVKSPIRTGHGRYS